MSKVKYPDVVGNYSVMQPRFVFSASCEEDWVTNEKYIEVTTSNGYSQPSTVSFTIAEAQASINIIKAAIKEATN